MLNPEMVWLYLRGAGTTNRISLLQWDVAPIAEAIAQLPDMTAVQVSPIATLTVYFKPGSRSSGMTVRVHALESERLPFSQLYSFPDLESRLA